MTYALSFLRIFLESSLSNLSRSRQNQVWRSASFSSSEAGVFARELCQVQPSRADEHALGFVGRSPKRWPQQAKVQFPRSQGLSSPFQPTRETFLSSTKAGVRTVVRGAGPNCCCLCAQVTQSLHEDACMEGFRDLCHGPRQHQRWITSAVAGARASTILDLSRLALTKCNNPGVSHLWRLGLLLHTVSQHDDETTKNWERFWRKGQPLKTSKFVICERSTALRVDTVCRLQSVQEVGYGRKFTLLVAPSPRGGSFFFRNFWKWVFTKEMLNTYRRNRREITTRRDRHKKQQKVCSLISRFAS